MASAHSQHVAFQNPVRAGPWGAVLDRFWLIAQKVMLGALLAQPGLWKETGSGQDSGEFQWPNRAMPATGVSGCLFGEGFEDAGDRGPARHCASP